MVRKKLAAAIAAIGALQAGLVSALGMGDFALNSALNQPLDAEIKLLNIDDLDETQVLVKMASAADFSNAGVSRDFFLTNIKFNVEVDGKGGGIIRVTTREPVVEPYLNFLVEARWPSGRMLREFTVLLDLPVFSDSVTKPVAQAVTDSSPASAPATRSSTASSRPAAASSTASRSQQATPRRDYSEGQQQAGEQYRVKNDDTLWEIAMNSRPGSDLSVQQTMVGIQRLNPQAFVNGNINRLKAGSVLRLPTREQISISDQQAIGEVANHNRAWKQGDDIVAPSADVPLDATTTDTPSGDRFAESARLSIATSGESDNAGFSEGEGSDTSGSAVLQDALANAEENLDKTSLENQELQSRLGDMEAKLATLQRLIELKDDQLAAMQADGGIDPASSTPAVDSELEAADQALAKAAEPKPLAAPAKPDEKGLVDQLLGNPLYAGGAGLLILAIAAIVLMRRRKAAQEAEEIQDRGLDEPDFQGFDVAGPAVLTGLDEAKNEELSDQDEATEQLVAELESEIAASNAVESAVVDSQPPELAATTKVESETGDVIAEADIYVAYGRYQQAIDLLRTAADQEPERTDLQLKLLEVYVETRDKPAFQQQYKVLQGMRNAAAIEQVKEMLSSVDGVSGWLDGLGEDISQFTDEDMDADLIEGATDQAASELDDIGLDLDGEADDDLELDLDTAITGDDGLELDLDDALELDEELSLDEDLDLSDLDEAPEQALADEGFDLDEELLLDLAGDESDDLSADKTVQYHVSDLQSHLDAEQAADEQVTDDVEGLDLGSADLAEGIADEAETEAAAGNGEFELDLEDDLDLESLTDADIGDLEAEFGESETAADSGDEQSFFNDEELASLGEDFDLDDVVEPAAQPDTKADEDLGADLDLDLTSLADTDATVEYSLDDVATELSAANEESLLADAENAEFDSLAAGDDVEDDDFDFLADTDEVATKLDLARAYIDMGDSEGAKDILDEVLAEGSEQQIQEANALVAKMS